MIIRAPILSVNWDRRALILIAWPCLFGPISALKVMSMPAAAFWGIKDMFMAIFTRKVSRISVTEKEGKRIISYFARSSMPANAGRTAGWMRSTVIFGS